MPTITRHYEQYKTVLISGKKQRLERQIMKGRREISFSGNSGISAVDN
jgi:hypothetical protein